MNPARVFAAILAPCLLVWAGGGCARRSKDTKSLDQQLIEASEKGDLASVQRLVKKGANVDAKDQSGWTPLNIAAGRGDAATVKFLLSKGAKADARDSNDATAWMEALQGGHTAVVELLLPGINQAMLNQAVFFTIERQPMLLIRQTGDTGASLRDDADPFAQTVNLLLEKGAKIDARNEEGATVLIEAAGFGRLAIVKMLLQRGGELEARSNDGGTALHAAARDCALATMPDTYDVVKLLLEKGAAINTQDNEGYTPLMIASGGGVVKTDIVRVLLLNGASTRLKNAHGETALTIALKSDVPDVVQLLKNPPRKAH